MGETPKCPACKSKFSHDVAMKVCKVCGLPDEVRTGGPKAIARWRRRTWTVSPTGGVISVVTDQRSKSERKRALHRHPARTTRNKHGRAGVKHAR